MARKAGHNCNKLPHLKVMLKPQSDITATAEEISARFRSVGSALTVGVLERLRKFVTLSRHMQVLHGHIWNLTSVSRYPL